MDQDILLKISEDAIEGTGLTFSIQSPPVDEKQLLESLEPPKTNFFKSEDERIAEIEYLKQDYYPEKEIKGHKLESKLSEIIEEESYFTNNESEEIDQELVVQQMGDSLLESFQNTLIYDICQNLQLLAPYCKLQKEKDDLQLINSDLKRQLLHQKASFMLDKVINSKILQSQRSNLIRMFKQKSKIQYLRKMKGKSKDHPKIGLSNEYSPKLKMKSSKNLKSQIDRYSQPDSNFIKKLYSSHNSKINTKGLSLSGYQKMKLLSLKNRLEKNS